MRGASMAIPHNRPASGTHRQLVSDWHPADRRVEGAELGVDRRVDTDVNVPIKPKGYVYHVMILLFG